MAKNAMMQNAILFICVLSGLPLGYISRKLGDAFKRKLFHIFCGLVMCVSLYGADFLIVVAGEVLIWAVLHLPGALCLSGIVVPIVEIFWIHFKRLGTIGEWKSDLSGLIMFSALRVIMLIISVFDGRSEPKREQWRKMALKSIPSLFDYFVYLFSFNGLFSGPILPYSVFMQSLEIKESPIDEKEDLNKSLKIWGIGWIYGICSASCVIIFPNQFILSDSFKEKSFIMQVILSNLFSIFHTSRYIFAWFGGEVALTVQGVKRLKESFDPEYCRSFRIEYYYTTRYLGGLVNEWNHSVHFFLKEFIHTRVLALGGSNLVARMFTFGFSAFWHGLYPGYYMYACAVMINGIVDGYRFKLTTPLFDNLFGKKFTFVFDCIYTQLVNNYQGATWDLLWAKPSIQFFINTKCGLFIFEGVLIFIGYLYRVFGPRPPRIQKDTKDSNVNGKEEEKNKVKTQ